MPSANGIPQGAIAGQYPGKNEVSVFIGVGEETEVGPTEMAVVDEECECLAGCGMMIQAGGSLHARPREMIKISSFQGR